jgi:hypothetical protein
VKKKRKKKGGDKNDGQENIQIGRRTDTHETQKKIGVVSVEIAKYIRVLVQPVAS